MCNVNCDDLSLDQLLQLVPQDQCIRKSTQHTQQYIQLLDSMTPWHHHSIIIYMHEYGCMVSTIFTPYKRTVKSRSFISYIIMTSNPERDVFLLVVCMCPTVYTLCSLKLIVPCYYRLTRDMMFIVGFWGICMHQYSMIL